MAQMAMSSLRAAGIVGVWTTDVTAGRSTLDAGAAAMMAGSPDLAETPLPLEVALGRTHPDDWDWVFGQIRRVRRTGGPFAAEFRVIDEDGTVRWILNRGCLIADEDGRMRGQGAYIDTTNSHRFPLVPAASFGPVELDPLQAATEHCLRARAAIDRTGNTQMRLLADLLLLEVGRALAQHLPARPV